MEDTSSPHPSTNINHTAPVAGSGSGSGSGSGDNLPVATATSLTVLDRKIHDNQMFVARKMGELQGTAKSNAFLEKVLRNYEDYYDGLVREKREQLRALEVIRQYLVQVSAAEDELGGALREQEVVSREISALSNALTELTHEGQKLEGHGRRSR